MSSQKNTTTGRAGQHLRDPQHQALLGHAHQALCRLGIAAALHQHVENKAVLINGAPKPVFLSTDSDDNLIEVPFVAEAAG